MIATIHQPCFFPYLGVFKKIDNSDILYLLDDVQYTKGEYFERNRIKTAHGPRWFNIPISYSFGDNINQCKPKDELGWQKTILDTLQLNYMNAPHYDEHIGGITELVNKKYSTLAEAGEAAILHIIKIFQLSATVKKTSELNIAGAKTERLINICKDCGAERYISGSGGKDYLDEGLFRQAGIELEYSDFESREYQQQHPGFIPNLSVLDYLFNCGPDPTIWR